MTLRPLLVVSLCAAALWHSTLVARDADRRRNSTPAKPAPATNKAAPSSTKTAAAPGAAAPSPQNFDAFRIVVEKNIFNPNRVGRTREAEEERAQKVDEVALVGTVQYDQKKVAIFESRDAAYRKACGEGESCGEFKVQRITADQVEVMLGQKTITLKVAQQLRRVDNGEWSVTAVPSRAPEPRGGTASTAALTRPSAPSRVEIPANASETLKRLMQAREQQLKK